jgi:hypothetical protein
MQQFAAVIEALPSSLKTSQERPQHQQRACQGCANGKTDVALADKGRGDRVLKDILLHQVRPGGRGPAQSCRIQVNPIRRDVQGRETLYEPILYGNPAFLGRVSAGMLKGLYHTLLELLQGR